MNKKIFSLSIFAFGLAVLFLFAAPNGSMASENFNNAYSGSTNLIGIDEAHHSAKPLSRDFDRPGKSAFQSYGLHGDWEGQR